MPMAAGGATRAPPCPEVTVLKQQGNEALRQRRFRDAVDMYTQAISIDPKNAVLKANRAEAYLRQDKWQQALTDAEDAIAADPEYAKAHFRRGAALAGLRRHPDAVDAYLAAVGLKGADEALLQEKVDDQSSAAWPVTVRQFPTLGRALVATKDIAAGGEALCETPAITWMGGEMNKEVAEILQQHGISTDSAAAKMLQVVGTGKLTQAQMNVIRDLSAPELNLDSATTLLSHLNAARDIAQRVPSVFSSDPYYVARVMLAAKTNAHHVAAAAEDGTRSGGIFRLGSKLSHSCAPNCIFHMTKGKVRFTAARHVSAGEMVTFSYRGELDFVEMPANKRQAELMRLFYFHCECDRCGSDDANRCIRCDCGPSGYRVWKGAYPAPGSTPAAGAGWSCDDCGRRFSAEAMAPLLAKEAQLEEQADKLVEAPAREPAVLSRLTDALQEAHGELGDRHWVYGRILRRLATQYGQLVRAGGGEAAAQLMLAHGALQLQYFSDTGMWRHAPLLTAHVAAVLATRLGDLSRSDSPAFPSACGATIRDAATSLLKFACPLMRAVYTDEDETTRKALELAASLGVELAACPQRPLDTAGLLPKAPSLAELRSALAQGLEKMAAK